MTSAESPLVVVTVTIFQISHPLTWMGKLSFGAEPPCALPSVFSASSMVLMDSSHSLVSPRKKWVSVFIAIAESTISALMAAT